MQFIENGVYLSISELNTDNQITIHCGIVGQELNEDRMVLTAVEILRLGDWINEAAEQLK